MASCLQCRQPVARNSRKGKPMPKTRAGAVAGTVLAMVIAGSSALAQQTVRIRGPIASVDGSIILVKAGETGTLTVALAENVAVFSAVKAQLADIKPGSFIGVGAMPQADGSQRAIQITIFSESQRGTGEGHRPWDRPNSTMTNGTVDVAGVEGDVLLLKYKDGEKKIIVGPETVIRAYTVGSKDELKPGANVSITNATKKPDGSFEASRITVGREGVVP